MDLDPDGAFQGNTLAVWWNPVRLASRYLVVVEQCKDGPDECQVVVDLPVNGTRFDMTSAQKFGPCTFYTLKVSSPFLSAQLKRFINIFKR